MTFQSKYLLGWAAGPALVLSVWLLHTAQAPPSVLILQTSTLISGIAVYIVVVNVRSSTHSIDPHWFALILALSLFIPTVTGSMNGVERWIDMAGVRLYVASVVLPLAVLFLGATTPTPSIYVSSVVAAVVALVLQPDASQLTAFGLAILVHLATLEFELRVRAAILAVLACGFAVAWSTPDPLAPVAYVEGVFNLAAGESPIALLAAIAFALLPVIALMWMASTMHSFATLAVAIYYASLLALAPLQATPVPLLGFGAGPILGYFLVSGVISRQRVNYAA